MDIAVHTLAQLRDWDAFNAASDQGTVFSSAAWLKLLAATTGADLTILAATEGKDIRAAVPLLKRKKLWYNVVTTMPLSPYNGVLLSDAIAKEAHVHEVLTELLKTGLSDLGFAAISVHPSFTDMRPFMWEGWQVRKLYTYWVDITSDETCWNNFSQSLRRKVRRAHDEGITVRENNDPDLLTTQYAYSYHRHGIEEPIPMEQLCTWVTELTKAGMGTIFSAYDSSETAIASRLVIADSPFVYDWLAGSSKAGDAHSANHVLVGDIMAKYSGMGYSTFDFRGANTPGVIDFKRSFGGLLMSYHQAEFRNSALLSLAEKVRSSLTQLRRGV